MPTSTREAIERAIHWIGISIEERDVDRRLVWVCAALEALLSLKSDRRKGETIARRLALLYARRGRPMVHPSAQLLRYEGRSALVHGSRVRVATEEDYHALRVAATEGVEMFIEYALEARLKRHAGLLADLDRREDLLMLADWLERGAAKKSPSGRIARDARLHASRVGHILLAIENLWSEVVAEVRRHMPARE